MCGRSAEAITADGMINNVMRERVCRLHVCAVCICHARMCTHTKQAFLQKANRSCILLPVDAHARNVFSGVRGCPGSAAACVHSRINVQNKLTDM